MTSFNPTATVAEIVAENPAAADVFDRHAIDYCCHGDVSLDEACSAGHTDVTILLRELEAAVAGGTRPAAEKDVRSLSVPGLVARIVDRHHGYLRTALPFLATLAAKVARAHGDRDSRLIELNRVFVELKGLIEPHLDQEERELFPALMARRPSDQKKVRADLKAMFEEHQAVGELLHRLRVLGGGYLTPEWGCNTYQLLMIELDKLEKDVLRHIHLENHVLMPRFME
jgi:regulator of cell morphogenesis and NO signaling